MKHINITINHLDRYMQQIRKETKLPKTSLYEYIESHLDQFNITPGEQFILKIQDIDFSEEKNTIDLSDANLSGVILKNINFSGDNVIIKGANLIGCQIQEDTKFTSMISLDGVNFGPITLDSEIFVRAALEKSLYDPSNLENIMLPLSQRQISEYLALPEPRSNLNAYLTERLAHRYPGYNIIADLSGVVIDHKFSNSDISGSNLMEATITGDINGLIMRDCITYNSKFHSCNLTNFDLRGTALFSNNNIKTSSFNDVSFRGGRFSVNKKQVELLIDQADPLANQAQTFLSDDIVYDPCYNKEHPDLEKVTFKCSREDLESYIEQGTDDDFVTFIKERNRLSGNVVADFSEQNLSDLDLSDLKFINCDFSGAIINGCKLNNSVMENCNFSGATSSASVVGSKYPIAYRIGQALRGYVGMAKDKPIEMHGAIFTNCDLTSADLTGALGRGVTFENVTAIGLNAPNLTLESTEGRTSKIINSNFRGANLSSLYGENLVIDRSDFTLANFKPAFVQSLGEAQAHLANDAVGIAGRVVELKTFSVNRGNSILLGSVITRSNFNHSNFEQVDLTGATFSQCSTDKETNLASATLNGANLSESKLHGNVRRSWQSWLSRHAGTNVDKDTDFTNADFQLDALSGDLDISKAVESIKGHEAAKASAQEKIDKNTKMVYNRYAKILLGALIGAAIVGTVLFPPLLGAIVPVAMAVAITQGITYGCFAGAVSLGTELITQNSVNQNAYSGFSLIKPVANLFGAEKIIKRINAEYEKDKTFHSNMVTQLQKTAQDVERRQPQIIGTSKAIERLLSKEASLGEARKKITEREKPKSIQHAQQEKERRKITSSREKINS